MADFGTAAVTKAQTVLVDDHPLFRSGLAAELGRLGDLELVGEASSAAEALALASSRPLDLVVIDVLMPGISGITLAAQLRERHPECKVLALSVIDEPGLIADMLRAGASGYALKSQPPAEIFEAIHTVLGGVRYLPPGVSHDAIMRELTSTGSRPLEHLTCREREVFELLIRGHSNDQISSLLFISRRTVETHRQRVMNKLSARSIIEMIRVAARHGGLAE